jgi:hypothetical protein
MLVEKGRNVVADIENEPDGDKTCDAVKVDLQEITNDVAIQESHRDFRMSICELRITITPGK